MGMSRVTVWVNPRHWYMLKLASLGASEMEGERVTVSELVRRGIARELYHQDKRRQGFTYTPPDPVRATYIREDTPSR